jgi:flagellar export protein FliJ
MSRKFRFNLDVVLRLREQREKAARQGLAAALAEAQGIEIAARRLGEALTKQQAQRRATIEAEATSAATSDRASAVELQRELAAQGVRPADARRRLAAQRERLLEAMRQRKALGRLKELRQRRHAEVAERRFTFELDDLFSSFTSSRQWCDVDGAENPLEVKI